MKEKRIEAFTASGTFTVPAGVTYAIAHMLGGGGGVGTHNTGSPGGTSSVDFAGGTVIGRGLSAVSADSALSRVLAGANNTGQSARFARDGGSASGGDTNQYNVAGDTVTPAASITVTVGAGGAAGTNGAAGGSGYVYIEFSEAV